MKFFKPYTFDIAKKYVFSMYHPNVSIFDLMFPWNDKLYLIWGGILTFSIQLMLVCVTVYTYCLCDADVGNCWLSISQTTIKIGGFCFIKTTTLY